MSTSLLLSSLASFANHLWVYWLRRALCLAILSVIFSSVRLSIAQSGSTMTMEELVQDENGSNDTIFPPCLSNMSCENLPGHCINCSFDYSCHYGNNTTVTCSPRNGVDDCRGSRSFERTFVCQYCYQLPANDTCCTTNTSCSVRGTPNSLYIANCTAKDAILCLPPRNFTKQLRCNYSTGRRWTTAFLLSFTLGGFGVDRFYLNHWGSACGKLVTFGGLGVWSILDVILVGTGYLGPADGSAYV